MQSFSWGNKLEDGPILLFKCTAALDMRRLPSEIHSASIRPPCSSRRSPGTRLSSRKPRSPRPRGGNPDMRLLQARRQLFIRAVGVRFQRGCYALQIMNGRCGVFARSSCTSALAVFQTELSWMPRPTARMPELRRAPRGLLECWCVTLQLKLARASAPAPGGIRGRWCPLNNFASSMALASSCRDSRQML